MRTLMLAALALAALAGPAAGALTVEAPAQAPEGTAFAVTIRADAGTDSLRIDWLERSLRPAPTRTKDGVAARLLLGVGMRERLTGEVWTLSVHAWRGGEEETLLREIRRVHRDYPEQHLDVDRKYSELSDEDLARHEHERAAIRAALARQTPAGDWPLPFARPVGGRVTSEFGFRRFFNGEPKNPHSGTDLAGKRGTPVLACADGVVSLADEHFFAGRSVYVDHGGGVTSMYFHLEEIRVEPGERVLRGQIIGLVGDSGRVTGPHLHWGLSVQGQLVDPLPLAE